jgi:hypothetical protein
MFSKYRISIPDAQSAEECCSEVGNKHTLESFHILSKQEFKTLAIGVM